MKVFDKQAGSVLRNLIRAAVTLVSAFGFHLSGEQVGAIMLFTEAVLSAGTLLSGGRQPDA